LFIFTEKALKVLNSSAVIPCPFSSSPTPLHPSGWAGVDMFLNDTAKSERFVFVALTVGETRYRVLLTELPPRGSVNLGGMPSQRGEGKRFEFKLLVASRLA